MYWLVLLKHNPWFQSSLLKPVDVLNFTPSLVLTCHHVSGTTTRGGTSVTGSTWLSDSLSGKKKGGVREYPLNFTIVFFAFLVYLLQRNLT